MSLVLDGSAALAWCFKDEATAAIDAVMEQVTRNGAIVPSIWRLEVANALQTGLRRGRLTDATRDGLLTAFASMKVRVDTETDWRVWPDTVRLAEAHGLTVYDASYLELARRLGLPLATLDKALRRAAADAQVALLGL